MPKHYLRPLYCPQCGRDPVILNMSSGSYRCQNTLCLVSFSVTILKETE